MLVAADPERLEQLVAAVQRLQASSTLLLAAAVALLVVALLVDRAERQRDESS